MNRDFNLNENIPLSKHNDVTDQHASCHCPSAVASEASTSSFTTLWQRIDLEITSAVK